jgi:hypothetical protein
VHYLAIFVAFANLVALSYLFGVFPIDFDQLLYLEALFELKYWSNLTLFTPKIDRKGLK